MTTVFACVCGKELRAPEEFAGRTTKCPGCGQPVTIPGPQAAAPVPAAASPTRNRLAQLSLALGASALGLQLVLGGLVSVLQGSGWLAALPICLPLVLGLPAVVMGIIALPAISRSQGQQSGTGFAIGGLALGLLVGLCGVGFMITGVATNVRASANRVAARSNLHSIGLALHNYHDSAGQLPRVDERGLSWRVRLLPFLEEEALYQQFKLDEPWDSPHNLRLVQRMPKVYSNPRFEDRKDGRTYFRAITGPGTVFGSPEPMTLGRITNMDGTPWTWLVVEAGEAVPWTKPEELVCAPDKPLPAFGGPQRLDFLALFADAHVETFPQRPDDKIYRAHITVDGKERVP